jgi:hypothetical protein
LVDGHPRIVREDCASAYEVIFQRGAPSLRLPCLSRTGAVRGRFSAIVVRDPCGQSGVVFATSIARTS